MARTSEGSNHGIPNPPDVEVWRHWGDGFAGRMVGARIQGYSSALLDYVDVAVDANGNLLAALSASSVEIGTVDQGTPGAQAWKVDGSAVTQPVSIASMPSTPVTGPLTDTQLRATAVPVSGSLGRSWTLAAATDSVNVGNFPVTQPVSAASLPLPAGAATDATLAAAIGTAAVDPPSYGTVLDRLIAIERAVIEQGEALLAAFTSEPAVPSRPLTLLHRS